MAVSINRVYETVLSVLNKEQRGYLPPEEFNRFAVQVQKEIFENYFYELGRASMAYGKGRDVSNITGHVFEKISGFASNATMSTLTLPTDLYRIENILYNDIPAFEKTVAESGYLERSSLTQGTTDSPYFTRTGNTIALYPTKGGSDVITIQYYKKISADPAWAGTTINGSLVESGSTDFELHESEENELVAKILTLAGVVVRAADVTQAAMAKEQQINQSEQ